jgi:DNA-binding transcriptional LysR family regulator
MDTLECMRVYACVVDAGGFSAAARRLGLSKALASKYVGQLEQRLGVCLLNRTTRKLTPTEIGKAYYARCARIVGEVEDLEGSLHADHATPRGHLRIAGPRIFGEDALVGCVTAFLEKHAGVSVDLVLDERTVDIVAEGFDLAVRIGELADTRLIARRITSYRYALCASPEYLAGVGAPVTPEAVTGHACIVNSAISPTNHWLFMVEGKRRSVAVRPRIRVIAAGRCAIWRWPATASAFVSCPRCRRTSQPAGSSACSSRTKRTIAPCTRFIRTVDTSPARSAPSWTTWSTISARRAGMR